MTRWAMLAATLVVAWCACADALATVQRTFVSSAGNDANPCSLALPCRGFSAAISQTTAGGEVVVLDSAGYGTVSITQSVAIVAPAGVYAGISVLSPLVDGISIGGADIDVLLSGLTINGQGGNVGIRITNARSVSLERCAIRAMGSQGIYVQANSAVLTVRDSELTRNEIGIAVVFGGAIVNIADTRIYHSAQHGLVVDTATTLQVHNSEIAHNGGHGAAIFSGAFGYPPVTATITDSRIVHNQQSGLIIAPSSGTKAEVRIANSTLGDNGGAGIGVTATTDGMAMVTGSQLQVVGNLVGISVVANLPASGGGALATIADSVVSRNAHDGVSLWGPPGVNLVGAQLSRNQIEGNGFFGIICQDGQVGVQSNTIVRNGQPGLAITNCAALTDGKNKIYQNAATDVQGGPLTAMPVY